jgi:branched-chain amino acid transport system permease protein
LAILLIQAVILGLLSAGVYALMASGLTLIFGVMRIVNVGQGALVILGAYLSFALLKGLHIDPLLSLVVTMPVMFGFGVLIEIGLLRRLRTDREALSILVTFALALGIEGALGYFFSSTYEQLVTWYQTASFPVPGFRITYIYLFGFLLGVGILSALFAILYLTSFGAAVRATMQNRTAAQVIGINVDRVSALAFGIGVSTAAAGGVVFGVLNSFNPGSHYDLISRLLTIIVLGGLGSLRGAAIAAAFMLVTENLASVVLSPVWGGFVFFVVLVVVLIVRPQGVFGTAEAA